MSKQHDLGIKVVPIEPYKLVCNECGGENLTFDATCHWSPDKQDWVINEKIEGVPPACGNCGYDTDAELKFDDTIKTVNTTRRIK